MMSRIFCCNPTILKKNLARYWPIMVICGFIAFMLLPMTISETDDFSVALRFEDIVSYIMPLLIFGYAPLCAACVFGYLHKSRSSNMLHAFPVTRDSLFMSNLLSGLAMFVLPWLGVCLVTLFLFLSNGIHLGLLLSSFVIGCLEFLFFFAVAVFSMLLCGKTVYGILIYLFLQVGLALMELLIMTTIEPFLFGVATGYTMLSDYLPLIYTLCHPVMEVANKTPVELCYNWGILAILGGLGIGFLALAWLLYRKRHMEHCGDPIAYPRIQPIVLVVVSLFASLALGLFITAICFTGGVSAKNATGMHIALLIGGFMGFFGVEMLLRKTTRVFQKKTFIGYGIFAVAMSLMLFCVRYDWLNIVGYVPESDCVTIQYSEVYDYDGVGSARLVLTDAESIAAFREIHQSIVDNRNLFIDNTNRRPSRYYLHITYKLDNGKEVKRKYEIWADPFYHQSRTVYEAFEAFLKEPRTTMTYLQALNMEDGCKIFVTSVDRRNKAVFETEQFERIRQAMLLDAQEGTLELVSLLSFNRWFNNGNLALEDNYDRNLAEHLADGYLLQHHNFKNYRYINGHDCLRTLYIPKSATHTCALLTELLN